jgi:hypothetical protein
MTTTCTIRGMQAGACIQGPAARACKKGALFLFFLGLFVCAYGPVLMLLNPLEATLPVRL